jgi:hypothetical protein
MKKLATLCAVVVGAAVLSAAPFSLRFSPERTVSLSLDTAAARIGRPWTPFSIAGVHRRAIRRAYYGGYGYGTYASPWTPYGYGYGAYTRPSAYSSYGYGYGAYSPTSPWAARSYGYVYGMYRPYRGLYGYYPHY